VSPFSVQLTPEIVNSLILPSVSYVIFLKYQTYKVNKGYVTVKGVSKKWAKGKEKHFS